MNNVIGLDGKPKKPNPTPTCHMRLCLIASDDIDIKNIQTFGIADDGFFMVNPARIKSIEIFKDGEKPLTKLKKAKSDDDFLLDLLKKKHETQSKNK